MAIEREIKLTADVDLVLPDLTGAVAGLTVGSRSKLRLDAVYYDTPTLSMARSGVTLRSRSGEPGPIWTLKIGTAEKGHGLSRHEYTFDEPLAPVPIGARQAARALTRSQALVPVVRLHTDRTQFTLDLDGRPLLKFCDDVVTAEGAPDPVSPFREIELELCGDDVDVKAVKAVSAFLKAAGCRGGVQVPKAIRALGPRALGPPDVEVMSLGKRATTRALLREVIGKSVAQIVIGHAGVWVGDDPEDLHAFRVAARRLRSDLRTFSPLLDHHWTVSLRDELAWLGAEVGLGRDADVLAERLRSQMKRLPAEDAPSVDRLLEHLVDNSNAAREHVVAALSADRYVELLDSLVEAAREPRFAADKLSLADEEARSVFRDLVRKPWQRLRRDAEALKSGSPDAAFHAVRIRSKRARYAAEAVEPVHGRDARRFAEAVAEVQSVLGDHQDTAVAEAWLRNAAQAVPSARLVIGELVAIERLEQAALRKQFKSVWKKTSRRKLRSWLD